MINEKLSKYCEYLSEWILNYCKKAKTNGVIVGISGGVDSALAANIAAKNKNFKVLGVWMNIGNSPLDIKCVDDLKKQNRFEIINVSLEKTFDGFVKLLKLNKKITKSNLKARLRAVTLYSLAQENNLLVLGTGNADELYTGYFTKFGDGACDLMPLSRLTKNDVFELAKYLKLPESIINRAPSAGLYDGQTDENELGISYANIDNFLLNKKVDSNVSDKINHLHQVNLHKLSTPVMPKPFKKLKEW